jgi:ParB family chromosome partitioning protein
VQALQRGEAQPAAAPKKPDPDIQNLERELGELLSAKVAVQHGRGGRGKLVVQYFSLDELEGILERIRR